MLLLNLFIDLSGYTANTSDRHKNITMGTSGVKGLRIDANGNIGIGTTNPQSKLDINGNMTIASGAAAIQLAGNQPYHGLQYSNTSFTNTFVDGPVLYGWSGGGLGIKKKKIGDWLVLKWNAGGECCGLQINFGGQGN